MNDYAPKELCAERLRAAAGWGGSGARLAARSKARASYLR